jgi:hypothetical protein
MAAMIFIPRAIDPTPKPKKDAPAPAFPEAPAELPAVEKVE